MMLKNKIEAFYNSCLFYGGVLLLPTSPGKWAWRLFKDRQGIVSLVNRDLICDVKTLSALPKNDQSLDEFTNAFSPFIPLLVLNDEPWKIRRKVLSDGLRKMSLENHFDVQLPHKKGDIYWDVFKILFHIGFKTTFGRSASSEEYEAMYPGIEDINRLIKRQTARPNRKLRENLYNKTVSLIHQNNPNFVFADHEGFKSLNELSQVSIIVEDLLTSICIQCTDLICHLILLYPQHKKVFSTDLDNCIDETLRMYPLTDIWTRKAYLNQRGWIASLIQLNRAGWSDPDLFIPDRWKTADHPELISWGFDARSCPATKIGYNLSKSLFQSLVLKDPIWIEPASNYVHDRTFQEGCQVWIGQGTKPDSVKWNYPGKWQSKVKQWFNSRLRVLDQKELW